MDPGSPGVAETSPGKEPGRVAGLGVLQETAQAMSPSQDIRRQERPTGEGCAGFIDVSRIGIGTITV
jgi:hypothetical protein